MNQEQAAIAEKGVAHLMRAYGMSRQDAEEAWAVTIAYAEAGLLDEVESEGWEMADGESNRNHQ